MSSGGAHGPVDYRCASVAGKQLAQLGGPPIKAAIIGVLRSPNKIVSINMHLLSMF
jgi:hypothetical protein